MKNVKIPKEHRHYSEEYRMGFNSGWNSASWCDMPEIGAKIPRHIDWVGYETVTEENIREVHEMYAAESESGSRDFSPFEFTASAFNKRRNPDAVWAAYDAGISAGICANLDSRYKDKTI